jgi:hypothetical protein
MVEEVAVESKFSSILNFAALRMDNIKSHHFIVSF